MKTYYLVRIRMHGDPVWNYITGYGQEQPKLWTEGLAKNRAKRYEKSGYIVELISIILEITVN